MSKKRVNLTGSRQNSEPAFLVLGKLRRAHGVKGEIPLELFTQMLELLIPDKIVFIGEDHQPLTIEKTRWKQDLLLIKFKGIHDRAIVSKLTNDLVYVKESQLPPLPAGEYYFHELIGLDVYEPDGHYLGVLDQILETGANDVYLIQNDDKEEVLIPATEETILEIDPDQEKMIVAKMEWYGEDV
jgi:16S rRNA processing protein RimM